MVKTYMRPKNDLKQEYIFKLWLFCICMYVKSSRLARHNNFYFLKLISWPVQNQNKLVYFTVFKNDWVINVPHAVRVKLKRRTVFNFSPSDFIQVDRYECTYNVSTECLVSYCSFWQNVWEGVKIIFLMILNGAHVEKIWKLDSI